MALLQKVGDNAGEAETWHSLGTAHHDAGRHVQTVDCFQKALSLSRALGDRYREAGTLLKLSDSHRAMGDDIAAVAARRRADRVLADLQRPL